MGYGSDCLGLSGSTTHYEHQQQDEQVGLNCFTGANVHGRKDEISLSGIGGGARRRQNQVQCSSICAILTIIYFSSFLS